MSIGFRTRFGRMAPGLVLAAVPLLIVSAGFSLVALQSGPNTLPAPPRDETTYVEKKGDEELAYLLVRLEKRTRQVIGAHYSRTQSSVPGVNALHKRALTRNGILPAAVADHVFAEVVPAATGGRAWVKMVVPEPRNSHNQGDATALELLSELQQGASSAERSTPDAYYYGEPIQAEAVCLRCHGEPAGEPDPNFPQYEKNGWREGDIVGAVIARVATEG